MQLLIVKWREGREIQFSFFIYRTKKKGIFINDDTCSACPIYLLFRNIHRWLLVKTLSRTTVYVSVELGAYVIRSWVQT